MTSLLSMEKDVLIKKQMHIEKYDWNRYNFIAYQVGNKKSEAVGAASGPVSFPDQSIRE